MITSTIDASQIGAPISKYLYGGFIEHGGLLMYRSLWSEMIDDRKFYFPITSKAPEAPARRQGGAVPRHPASQMAASLGLTKLWSWTKTSPLSAIRARALNSTPPRRTVSGNRD